MGTVVGAGGKSSSRKRQRTPATGGGSKVGSTPPSPPRTADGWTMAVERTAFRELKRVRAQVARLQAENLRLRQASEAFASRMDRENISNYYQPLSYHSLKHTTSSTHKARLEQPARSALRAENIGTMPSASKRVSYSMPSAEQQMLARRKALDSFEFRVQLKHLLQLVKLSDPEKEIPGIVENLRRHLLSNPNLPTSTRAEIARQLDLFRRQMNVTFRRELDNPRHDFRQVVTMKLCFDDLEHRLVALRNSIY